jgi:hypothetical protein
VQNGSDTFGACACMPFARTHAHACVQNEIASGDFKVDTLSNLTSLFVLQHAKTEHGWTPASAGMSDKDAMATAAAFGKFDKNEDNRLEVSEFKALCDAANFTLTDAEVQAAVKMLDTRSTGYIEFDEFASWWLLKGGSGKAAVNQ